LTFLVPQYDAIVFAYGASKDSKIGLEGEDKPHVYSARAFVGWYNGLPEYRDLNPDLSAGDTAVVVGQGNVALDVARTLLSKIDTLRKTDMTEYAIQALKQSTIKHVHIVGRRGPMQAAFTIKEVRELLHLEDVNFKPIPDKLFPADIAKLPRPKKRMMQLLKTGSPPRPNATKSWSLDFLLSPTSLEWSPSAPEKLQGVVFARTCLEDPFSPQSKVHSTSESVTIPASTLLRSIGYKADAIPGMPEIGAIFDSGKGMIQHDGYGRIIPVDTQGDLEENLQTGLYCAGWVKRGPTGVIASTMNDAFETAEAFVQDWRKGPKKRARHGGKGWEGVKHYAEVKGYKLRPVHWQGWKMIDAEERNEGLQKGKPREKKGTVQEMLYAVQDRR